MFKNTLIFLLILLCGAQSYILYTNKDKEWLSQSIDQTRRNIAEIAKPSDSNNNTSSPQAATALIEKTSQPISTAQATTTITTTESFAFEHLKNNVNCESTTNIIDASICADVDLKDQDKRLNFILQKWESSNKVSEFPIASQSDWINLRFETCSKTTQSSIKTCIQSFTEKRIQAITGQI